MASSIARLAASLVAAAGLSAPAWGADDVLRIGFITDMSGVYADFDGQGGAEAIKLAIADAGGSVLGRKIELLTADHQNKADVAAAKAREWFDQQGVDLLIGGSIPRPASPWRRWPQRRRESLSPQAPAPRA